MRTLKYALGAAAAALIAVTALPASAATIITPITIDSVTGLGTINAFNALTSNTYDFTFSVTGFNDTLAQVQASIKGPHIEPISFDLFSGTPTGAHTLLGASTFANGANYEQVLGTGSYFLKLGSIVVNKELVSGSIELNAVPEPTTWAMMLVGIGGLGMAMRSSRRKQAVVAAA